MYQVSSISVDPRVGLSWTALETDDLLFFLPSTCIGKILVFMTIFHIFLFFSFFFFIFFFTINVV